MTTNATTTANTISFGAFEVPDTHQDLRNLAVAQNDMLISIAKIVAPFKDDIYIQLNRLRTNFDPNANTGVMTFDGVAIANAIQTQRSVDLGAVSNTASTSATLAPKGMTLDLRKKGDRSILERLRGRH